MRPQDYFVRRFEYIGAFFTGRFELRDKGGDVCPARARGALSTEQEGAPGPGRRLSRSADSSPDREAGMEQPSRV